MFIYPLNLSIMEKLSNESILSAIENLKSGIFTLSSSDCDFKTFTLYLDTHNICDILNIDCECRQGLITHIIKNRKNLNTSERYRNNSDHDCSGSCCGKTLEFIKIDFASILVRLSYSYDY